MTRPRTTRPAGRHDPTHPAAAGAREHLTITEVCAELQISRSTFYFWRQTGKAPRCVVLPNREIRITRDALDAWLTAHTETEAR